MSQSLLQVNQKALHQLLWQAPKKRLQKSEDGLD
jgi:hypothetical protein